MATWHAGSLTCNRPEGRLRRVCAGAVGSWHGDDILPTEQEKGIFQYYGMTYQPGVKGDRESGTPWNSRHGIRPSDPGQEYPEDTEGTSYTGFDARAVPGDSRHRAGPGRPGAGFA